MITATTATDGFSHRTTPGISHGWVRPAAAIGLLFLARMALPFADSDATTVHRAVAWALLHHQNWGRQALVAALEYPPLPTLAILVVMPVTEVLAALAGAAEELLFDPVRWVTALAQVWTLFYLARTIGLFTRRRWRWITAGLLLAIPALGPAMWQADPQWVTVLLAASIGYHCCRWERQGQLRDVVIIALNGGMLMLCGFTGAILAAVLVAVLMFVTPSRETRRHGVLALMLLPVGYVALLVPICNWLVMGDPFYALRRAAAFATGPSDGLPPHLTAIALAGAAGLGTAFAARRYPALRLVAALVLATAIHALCSEGLGLFLGSSFLLAGGGPLAVLCYLLGCATGPGALAPRTTALLLAVAAAAAACVVRTLPRSRERFVDATEPPPAAELMARCDRHWNDSRILLCDLRSAAIYVPAHPRRFVADIDFNSQVLQQQILPEQMHLLLPPDDGHYYPQEKSGQSRLHRHGARWLFLEHQWESGWQLWRCVRPVFIPAATAPRPTEPAAAQP